MLYKPATAHPFIAHTYRNQILQYQQLKQQKYDTKRPKRKLVIQGLAEDM